MMDLDQQLNLLVSNAPPDGVTPKVIEEAVAPILKLFAAQLQHLEYYVLQTLDQGWVLTTLSNRAQHSLEKKVIYAFANLQDASTLQGSADPQIVASPVPVTHILFQMFAFDNVDSAVFVETPGDLSTGVEIQRKNLKGMVDKQLEKLRPKRSNIPPNLA